MRPHTPAASGRHTRQVSIQRVDPLLSDRTPETQDTAIPITVSICGHQRSRRHARRSKIRTPSHRASSDWRRVRTTRKLGAPRRCQSLSNEYGTREKRHIRRRASDSSAPLGPPRTSMNIREMRTACRSCGMFAAFDHSFLWLRRRRQHAGRRSAWVNVYHQRIAPMQSRTARSSCSSSDVHVYPVLRTAAAVLQGQSISAQPISPYHHILAVIGPYLSEDDPKTGVTMRLEPHLIFSDTTYTR
ncbi:hypothetical protein OH76DRAFT_1184551 [Lentinus brumalis]|uniref:Uncharacterized protein n=1 Tax=Lentinus brumalis TaxID=2498619 RepID=A0A371CTZ3_9APHY|nr:hypothetical protein OH76DRAFT_1184551 [Polyporus brumalis]